VRLFRPRSPHWETPVLQVSALEERGMDAVWDAVQRHRTALDASGELAERRRQQQRDWLWSMLNEGLQRHFLARPDVAAALPDIEARRARGAPHPDRRARRLLALLDNAETQRRGGVQRKR
jgi:LAO/AO transport system kinase